MEEKPIPKIFFSAAEVSGDKHAAKLIGNLRTDLHAVNCEGLGGASMADVGCELMENLIDRSAMLTHAVKQVGFYKKLLTRVKERFVQNRPDLVVVIDSPAWNFHVAKAAKKLHIPVLHYIAPQLWAWGAWRINKLRKCTDKVACILPFEQEWFQARDVDAVYVGHPLFDDSDNVASAVIEDRSFPTVALLPGSRQHEIDRLWAPMQIIGRSIKNAHPLVKFVTVAPNDAMSEKLREKSDSSLNIEFSNKSLEAVTRHADLALIASGTATLETAAQHCPMIVMYHVGAWQWNLVGRWLLKTKWISLVNILAQRELVPEFIPFGNRHKLVAQKALEILADNAGRMELRRQLEKLVQPIIKPGASQNVTNIIKEMLPKY